MVFSAPDRSDVYVHISEVNPLTPAGGTSEIHLKAADFIRRSFTSVTVTLSLHWLGLKSSI